MRRAGMSEYLAAPGNEGKSMAVLSPYVPAPEHRVPGIAAGRVVIRPYFDAPLPEFEA